MKPVARLFGTALAAAAVACLLAPAAGAPAALEGALIPSLETGGGYDGNRFFEHAPLGSAYVMVRPALEGVLFLPRDLELSAAAASRHYEYARTNALSRDMVDGELRLRIPVDTWTFIGAAAGGLYTDRALPDDDVRWMSGHVLAAVQATPDLEWRLGATVTHTRYDSRLTASALALGSGETQAGTRLELRPGLSFAFSPALSLWADAFADTYRANDVGDDSRGLGAVMGIDVQVTPKWPAGFWLQGAVRDESEDPANAGTDRDPSSVQVGLQTSYRVRPWLDLLASGQYGWYRARDESPDYEAWTVQAGIRILYEIP